MVGTARALQGLLISALILGFAAPATAADTDWLGLRALCVTAAVPGAGRLLAGAFTPGTTVLTHPGEHRP